MIASPYLVVLPLHGPGVSSATTPIAVVKATVSSISVVDVVVVAASVVVVAASGSESPPQAPSAATAAAIATTNPFLMGA